MPITKGELANILSRKGYGLKSELKSEIGKRSVSSEISNSGSVHNVESDSKDELEGSKRIQIKCSGKVVVRIKFYRHRLADYSRAISEKAYIDSLQFAGILRGDSEEEIRLVDEGQEKVDSKEEERTEIIVEYPEVDFDDFWEESKRTDGR